MNNLLLLSGNDIPFPAAQIVIHTPTIREIGLIGEDDFYTGCSMINIHKSKFFSEQDKIDLKDKTDFDIFMLVIQDKEMQKIKNSVIMVLQLLFPEYSIGFTPDAILLSSYEDTQIKRIINSRCFKEFQSIVSQMFCLKEMDSNAEEETYAGDMARKIAAKLEEGRQKVARLKGQGKRISIFSYYISILTVGQQKDMNALFNYSVYQLYDEFKRFMRKRDYDEYVQMALAGAKDLKKVESWLKESTDEEEELST